MASLPPGYRREPGHQAKWLWRTLRAAELAGLDPAQILAAAIAERDLAGSRDIAAVIDARLRHRLGTLVPLPPGPWSAQVPAIADPDRRAYVAEIAALMDARKDRIGEHAADHAPPWAMTALGPVPGHPLDRLDWQRRAASIGAWRELSGYDHPADPIGPEPVAAAPDLRAAWHEALAALGPADGPDVRGMPDGTLLHLRDTYPLETAWAPQYVGDELRQVRAAAWDARLAAVRAAAEARAARRPRPARPRRPAAGAGRQLPGHAATPTGSAKPSSPPSWPTGPTGTPPPAHQRHLAVAADTELRRRHPARHYPPLRSAEPQPATQAQRDELTLTPGEPIPGEIDQWIKDLAAGHRTFADRLGGPAEPDDPVRGPRLRRPRPGVPRLDRTRPGADPAATQSPRSSPPSGSSSA